jgi:hypothetical protein
VPAEQHLRKRQPQLKVTRANERELIGGGVSKKRGIRPAPGEIKSNLDQPQHVRKPLQAADNARHDELASRPPSPSAPRHKILKTDARVNRALGNWRRLPTAMRPAEAAPDVTGTAPSSLTETLPASRSLGPEAVHHAQAMRKTTAATAAAPGCANLGMPSLPCKRQVQATARVGGRTRKPHCVPDTTRKLAKPGGRERGGVAPDANDHVDTAGGKLRRASAIGRSNRASKLAEPQRPALCTLAPGALNEQRGTSERETGIASKTSHGAGNRTNHMPMVAP